MAVDAVGISSSNHAKNLAFRGKETTPPRIISTHWGAQAGDEFASVAKDTAKPMSKMGRLAYKALLGLGVIGLGYGAVGCTTKEDPVPTPTKELTATEQAFNGPLAKNLFGVEIPAGYRPDSLAINDGISGYNIAYKYDKEKSTGEKIVFRTTQMTGDNDVQGYGRSEFTQDASGTWTAKNFDSAGKEIYNDPNAVLRNTTKYTKEGEKIIQTVDGTRAYSLEFVEAGKSLKQSLEYANVKAMVTKLFASFSKVK